MNRLHPLLLSLMLACAGDPPELPEPPEEPGPDVVAVDCAGAQVWRGHGFVAVVCPEEQ